MLVDRKLEPTLRSQPGLVLRDRAAEAVRQQLARDETETR